MTRDERKGSGGLTVLFATLWLVGASAGQGQETGSIEGRLIREDGSGVAAAAVVVADAEVEAVVTRRSGRFTLPALPPGTYSLSFTLGDLTVLESGLEVRAGETTRVEKVVDWPVSISDVLTVFAASRRLEPIFEAPAAVTVVTAEEVERQAATGQLPKLLEYTPGVEVAQNGLYWFNLNVRGFNSMLNRRVLVLIDGRDPSITYLGSQEWAAVSFPLDDLKSVELVHGPGSALYGADSYNGVLVLETRPPEGSEGGSVRLSGGELSTAKLDLRYAAALGGEWYGKVVGGYHESEDFIRPRVGSVEYSVPCTELGQVACVPTEAVPPPLDEIKIAYGGLRLDKNFGTRSLVLEAATAQIEGYTALSPVGRVQVTESDRPWARVNFASPYWSVQAARSERGPVNHTILATGLPFFLESSRTTVEAQGNRSFAEGRGFVVAGVSYREEVLDSADPATGLQTLVFQKEVGDYAGVYAQVEYHLTDQLKAVLAGRYDDGTFQDSSISPRASLIYSFTPNHSLRASYNQAFQVPAFSEFFVLVDLAAPVDLSPFEPICAAEGVSCGLDSVRVLAVGNESLDIEEVESIELGYTGTIGSDLFLSVNVYSNENEQFITDLIPFLNPELGGPINENYPPYQPPAALSPEASAALVAGLEAALPPDLFSVLSNDPGGAPIFTVLSFTNFGLVEVQGVDLWLTYRLTDEWTLDFSYSHADFDVQRQLAANPILPNSSPNRYSLGLAYVGERLDAALRLRASDDFDWRSGIYAGPVPAYEVVALTANYQLTDALKVGLDVSNLLDDEHYELFGGDLIGRRALAHVTYTW